MPNFTNTERDFDKSIKQSIEILGSKLADRAIALGDIPEEKAKRIDYLAEALAVKGEVFEEAGSKPIGFLYWSEFFMRIATITKEIEYLEEDKQNNKW